MAILKKTDKGITAIDNGLLRSMIIDIIKLDGSVVLCNKKAVPVKKTLFGGSDDIKNSVIVRDVNGYLDIKLYTLIRDEVVIDCVVEQVFAGLIDLLNVLCMQRKCNLVCYVMGVVNDDNEVSRAQLEFSTVYEQA